jgi:O-methyltransferase
MRPDDYPITSPVDRVFRRYSKAPRPRLEAMIDALGQIAGIEGDVVECGVWRGGHIMLARWFAPDRLCWLFDTFDGMPPPGPHDTKRSGITAQTMIARKPDKRMSRASYDEVIQSFENEGLLDMSKLRFVVGRVEDTLREPLNVPDKIALLRLDTDWYSSTKTELEILYPRLVQGGVLIIDDYGHWLGCQQAVNEYFPPNARARFERIDYSAIKMVKP